MLSMLELINQMPGYMGWKDKRLRFLGCNDQLRQVLKLNHAEDIVGLRDEDLIDKGAFEFHRQNDLQVLTGKTVRFIHQSTYPYNGELFTAIKAPLRNQNNQIIGIIFHCQPLNGATEMDSLLSGREKDCLKLLSTGASNKEIAAMLKLSVRTVECYLNNTKLKLNCRNRNELLIKSIQLS